MTTGTPPPTLIFNIMLYVDGEKQSKLSLETKVQYMNSRKRKVSNLDKSCEAS